MSKIVNVSNTTDKAALMLRQGMFMGSVKTSMMKEEAEKRGIDLSEVSKAVQERQARNTADHMLAGMKGKGDFDGFIKTLLGITPGEMPETPVPHAFDRVILESTPDRVTVSMSFCPHVQAWQSLGYDDEKIGVLCDSAMKGDYIVADLCGIKFTLVHAVGHGDPACIMVYERIKD